MNRKETAAADRIPDRIEAVAQEVASGKYTLEFVVEIAMTALGRGPFRINSRRLSFWVDASATLLYALEHGTDEDYSNLMDKFNQCQLALWRRQVVMDLIKKLPPRTPTTDRSEDRL